MNIILDNIRGDTWLYSFTLMLFGRASMKIHIMMGTWLAKVGVDILILILIFFFFGNLFPFTIWMSSVIVNCEWRPCCTLHLKFHMLHVVSQWADGKRWVISHGTLDWYYLFSLWSLATWINMIWTLKRF